MSAQPKKRWIKSLIAEAKGMQDHVLPWTRAAKAARPASDAKPVQPRRASA